MLETHPCTAFNASCHKVSLHTILIGLLMGTICEFHTELP